jgi:hypothetical protein
MSTAIPSICPRAKGYDSDPLRDDPITQKDMSMVPHKIVLGDNGDAGSK